MLAGLINTYHHFDTCPHVMNSLQVLESLLPFNFLVLEAGFSSNMHIAVYICVASSICVIICLIHFMKVTMCNHYNNNITVM